MKFRNVDPQGAIHADALGGRVIEFGEVVEVFGEVADRLSTQPGTWEQVVTFDQATDVPADDVEGAELP